MESPIFLFRCIFFVASALLFGNLNFQIRLDAMSKYVNYNAHCAHIWSSFVYANILQQKEDEKKTYQSSQSKFTAVQIGITYKCDAMSKQYTGLWLVRVAHTNVHNIYIFSLRIKITSHHQQQQQLQPNRIVNICIRSCSEH